MKLRTLLELGRVSNLPTVWSNMAAGWLLGGGQLSPALGWTVLGGSLLYLSGMGMNDACDAGWDRRNKGDRPIVRGQISRSSVWVLAGVYGIGGVAALTGVGTCPVFVAGLVASIAFYNVLHKKWAGSTLLMGSCRTFLYLVSASAANGGGAPSVEAVLWGCALGLFVVGLTFVARGESTGAPLIHWPLALLSTPVVCAVGFVIAGWPIRTLFFAVGFAAWTWLGLSVLRNESAGKARIGRAVGIFLAGMVAIDALAVSAGWPYLSLAFLAAAPLLLLFQRFIAAT